VLCLVFPGFPLSLRGWGNYSLGVSHSKLYNMYVVLQLGNMEFCFREKAECSRSGIVGLVIRGVFLFLFLFS
jgi:hypothetical protein